MELEQLKSLLSTESDTFEDLKKKIEGETAIDAEVKDLIDQFDIKKHAVNDPTLRKDKTITVTEETETTTGEVKKTNYTKVVPVARIALSLQKLIVSRAAAFLCGNPVELHATPNGEAEEKLLAVLKKTWEDNKLDYESKKLAKYMMSECRCAEIWYTEQVDPDYWKGTPNEGSLFKLRMKVTAPSLGDGLYPSFSASGDMVAFARGYTVKMEGKVRQCFDVYTESVILKGVKQDGGWQVTPEPNVVGKIPVVYYEQEQPEWADVQSKIDRLEKLLSNHADSNDYFGTPMMVISGKVEGMSAKGEAGKILELEPTATASMLTWQQAPESLKMEYQNLRSLIFDLTDTPDISIEQMKSLGTYSGIALKMLFLGAHLKAADKEETFGKGMQRRINFLLAALAKINTALEKGLTLSVKPKFEYYLPKNDQEAIQVLTEATTAGILSQQTAVTLNPLVEDKQAELDRLKEERDSAGALNEIMNQNQL
jgi:SPP1 family phage portal protein